MRGKSYEGKLPKTIIKGSIGHCSICKKDVKDLHAHNHAKHL